MEEAVMSDTLTEEGAADGTGGIIFNERVMKDNGNTLTCWKGSCLNFISSNSGVIMKNYHSDNICGILL